jgi:hypothetical protein
VFSGLTVFFTSNENDRCTDVLSGLAFSRNRTTNPFVMRDVYTF